MAEKNKGLTRRDFLKTSGIATGTLIGGGLIGGLIGYNAKNNTNVAPKEGAEQMAHTSPVGRKFFARDADFQILAQATERIFPKDDLGPGAIELGVPYFIDNQLAGSYGNNSREYMQGPFYVGKKTQGYQSPLTRAEIFSAGIAALEDEAQKRFKKGFTELEGGQMDEILTAFQKGEVKLNGVTSDFFFTLLRSATLEGAYSDPIYGGNHNMEGWKMKNFPGHQAAYINVIESDEFQKIKPQSLASMDH
jgi:gluconate 2-dehydrogenase gamma chain